MSVIYRNPINTEKKSSDKKVKPQSNTFLIILLVVFAILCVAFITIYFLSRSGTIKPEDCRLGNETFQSPLVVQPLRKGTSVAKDCPGNSLCQFTVADINDARVKCNDLGSRCAGFTLTQLSGGGYTMQTYTSTSSENTDAGDFYIVF